MLLGRVIGRVVATQQTDGLQGQKFLIVEPVDEYGAGCANSLVACDVVGSGLGDLVHVCDGRESTLALPVPFVPVDATIVGYVEQFDHDVRKPRPNGTRTRPDLRLRSNGQPEK
jgi:ethanolamine utilization protein EutN